jgi:5-methyltetrahydropteroyltriglutamate--homocysteine methyltransferase
MINEEDPVLRDTPPFRADHVGSLLRPINLLRARDDHAAGRIDDTELRRIEDDAIDDVIALQREVGLRSATDGEFRRASWHLDFISRLDGVSEAEDNLVVHFRNALGEVDFTPAALRVDGTIGLSTTIFGDAFAYLRDHVEASVTPKLTIPSPSMVHYRGGQAMIDQGVYPELSAFWTDLTAAYQEEVKRLYDLGCRYLQLDDTSLAYLNDPEQRRAMAERGEDAEHLHESYIAHLNEAIAGRPDGLTVTTHMCRGNFRSSWVAEGGYDFVAEALFNQLDVDAFFMEYDDERSGTFEPLRFVPSDKIVVLGLVTTKRGELESKDALKSRLDEASRYIDLDQVCISPQCGFSSTAEGNTLTRDEQQAKLALLVELAEEIWG